MSPKPTPRWIKRWRESHHGNPLPMVFINAMGSSGVRPSRSWAILNLAMNRAPVKPVLIAGTECQVLESGRMDPKQWDVIHDQQHPDRAGLFFALDRARGRVKGFEYLVGTPRVLGKWVAISMRNRDILRVTFVMDEGTPLEQTYVIDVLHMPPKRNWLHFWAHMGANVRRNRADFYVADWNKLSGAVVTLLGLRVLMDDIVGWAVRWKFPVSGPFKIDAHGDHPAVMIVVFPTTTQTWRK